MALKYFRRFRMEFDFEQIELPAPVLPPGYGFVAWDPDHLDRHALVKFHSFRAQIDSRVFRCLGEYDGCYRLMREISGQRTFLPAATWLISGPDDQFGQTVDVATIQGLAPSGFVGAVQNVGVVPEHRGLGLGRAVVLRSLAGFRDSGMRRVYLEVTAENAPAVHLYHSLGFRLTRTMYKAAECHEVTA